MEMLKFSYALYLYIFSHMQCLKRKPTVFPEQKKEESDLTGKKRLHDSGWGGDCSAVTKKQHNLVFMFNYLNCLNWIAWI